MAELGLKERWRFEWITPAAGQEVTAQVTGQLRWRGFEFGFALDSLLGIDGRLAAPSVAMMATHLQQLVLCHFADECLQVLAGSLLSDIALTLVEWHEEPQPMQGEFGFLLQRPGVRATSQGCLIAFNEAGRMQLMNALAIQSWALPAQFVSVSGYSQIGTVCLTPEEIAGLEVGDFVWIADAEISPLGVRAQFQPNDGQPSCTAWIKRSSITRDALPAVELRACGHASDITLSVRSPAMQVARSWFTGTQAAHRFPESVLTMQWLACHGDAVIFQGQLMVVGRRLGLRITHVSSTPQIKQVI
jgi:hypothetical protein